MGVQVALSVLQGNDTLVSLAVLQADQKTPQNCTGLTPRMVVKGAAQAADVSGATLTPGAGLVWVTQSAGTLTASLSRTLLATPGTMWWRLDLVDGSGDVDTAMYGPLVITPV